MSLPSEYQIIEKIYESDSSIVCRAIHTTDKKRVIIKQLKNEFPTVTELSHLRHEYELISSLTIDGIIQVYAFDHFDNIPVIIEEDFGGDAIDKHIASQKLNLETFLNLGISIAGVVAGIHHQNIIHKDINPSNIVWNPQTQEVKIIDFGISTKLTCETPAILSPNMLEGTLAYISPEQTGRMNRMIDHRTDMYSLGVTFYDMLVGHPPFQSDDAMELVHSHIAVEPKHLKQVDQNIPATVSDIVQKLLAKTAEDRYQSAFGLKADLQHCLDQLKNTGDITDFEIGQKDFCEKFQIPQKLYGRRNEIDILLSAFDNVSKGNKELTLVAGYAGIGKTALIHEVHKPIVKNRGYFSFGKFDQFKRDIPYQSLIQAVSDLLRQILTEKEAHITQWKTKILNALRANAQVIINVIPELELIIGKQPDIPELPPVESKNRFHLTFQNFIQALAQKQHPLTIFLDDLQWADLPSLKMIELMMTDIESKYIFIIGAYRDNEVNPAHPLMLMLEELQKSDVKIKHITLGPLEFKEVNQLISETVIADTGSTLPLSEICYEKTQGNPFFLNQFLYSIYQSGLIACDIKTGRWQWDAGKIKQVEFTDNVVDLLITKIKTMPQRSQHVLQLAACIDNRTDLKTLSIVTENSIQQTNTELWEAVVEGLIIPTDNSYKFINKKAQDGFDESQTSKPVYKFIHDRIQYAAYTMIPEANLPKIHLKIGRLLLENISKSERESEIFTLVNHFNKGKSLIEGRDEKNEAARLNLAAARKAKANSAFESALTHAATGMEYVDETCWQTDYELSFALFLERAECEYLNGNFEQSEVFFNRAYEKTGTTPEKIKIHYKKTNLYAGMGEHRRAVNEALKNLSLIGINLPYRTPATLIAKELLKLKLCLRGKKIEKLADLPQMTDPDKILIMDLLMNLCDSAYFVNQNLMVTAVLMMVRLSVKFGNSKASPYAYSVYAGILGSSFGDYKSGYKFGKLAIALDDNTTGSRHTHQIYGHFGTFVNHWRKHVKTNMPYLKKAYQHSLEVGDIAYTMYISAWNIWTRSVQGMELNDLKKQNDKFLGFLNKLKSQADINMHVLHGMISNLKGEADEPFSFNSNAFDEKNFLEVRHKVIAYWYYIQKLELFYRFDKLIEAAEMQKMARKNLSGPYALMILPDYYFYSSLLLTADFFEVNSKERKKRIATLKKYQKKLKKWARHCEENILHKYLLVSAEIERVKNQKLKCMELYDHAIESAGKNGFIQNEALANELAMKFWLYQGKVEFAKTYFLAARYANLKWGATAKIADLEKKYPQFMIKSKAEQTPLKNVTGTIKTTPSSGKYTTDSLDVSSVMKASQAMSGEIILSNLLKKLMKVVIENAGAQKGILILKSEKTGALQIEAEGATDRDDIHVFQSVPVKNNKNLPESIIYYVARTEEHLVLHDATESEDFNKDNYVLENQPKSILCMPIIHQSELHGLLYLENNLATGAFTPERMELLKLIASQAAISIENARLYARSVKSEKKYRQIFDNTVEGIFQASFQGNFIDANEAMAKMFGYESSEAFLAEKLNIGRQCFLNFNDAMRFDKTLRKKGEVIEFETQGIRKDGSTALGLLSAQAVYDNNGKILHYDGSIVDITERKNKEISDRQREAAEAATRAKSDFLATMSHEIRTPMNAILGMTYLLSETTLSYDQKDFVETINASGELLLSVINDILDFSKIEAGQIELEKTEFDLMGLVETTGKILTAKAHEKGLELICRVAPDVHSFRIGDPTRLRQIFINLLGTAIKFTEQGEVVLEVANSDDPTVLKFCVQDTGIGIPEDKQQSIFDSFSQVDTSTTRKFGGTGLGLTICKRLVELMDGRIWIESEEGKGTRFYFTTRFPVTDQLPESIATPVRDLKPKSRPEEITLPSLHILMAEDIVSNQKVMKLYLKDTPVKMDIAENGKIAVEKFTGNTYDVVLMDIEMPEMDGLAATRAIRKWEKENNKVETPVIALTAHAFDEHMKKCFDAGCNGFLPKPLKKRDLLAALGELFKE